MERVGGAIDAAAGAGRPEGSSFGPSLASAVAWGLSSRGWVTGVTSVTLEMGAIVVAEFDDGVATEATTVGEAASAAFAPSAAARCLGERATRPSTATETIAVMARPTPKPSATRGNRLRFTLDPCAELVSQERIVSTE